MLLNSDELFGFVHLPASAVRSPVLVRDAGKTKAAPDIVQHPPGVIIGDNDGADNLINPVAYDLMGVGVDSQSQHSAAKVRLVEYFSYT